MLFGEENSYFMQSVLVLFCLKKMPWSYKFFRKTKKFPNCLRSAYLYKIEILPLQYCPRTNPPTSNHHQHTNFVHGTQCYSLSLKCSYTSSDTWIRHCHASESLSYNKPSWKRKKVCFMLHPQQVLCTHKVPGWIRSFERNPPQ